MVLKRVALTGASGMVGQHILALLNSKNIEYAASSRQQPELKAKDCLWSFWDLREYKSAEALDEMFPDVDGILHVGAIVPKTGDDVSEKDLFDANVRACLCLGRWAIRKNIHIVFLSGATVYAETEGVGITENAPKGYKGFGGFYGFTKLLAEEIFYHFREFGLKLTVLRPSSIYGYGLHEQKMISQFLLQASRGRIIELVQPVNDKIDFIHACDVAKAMLQVLEKDIYGVFNIASESPSSVLEVAAACVRVVGKGGINVPEGESPIEPTVRFGLSCEAARNAFSFSPSIKLLTGIELMWRHQYII